MRGRAVTLCVALGLVAVLDAIALAPLFRSDQAPVEPVAEAVEAGSPAVQLAAPLTEPTTTEPPPPPPAAAAPRRRPAATTTGPSAAPTTLRQIAPERVAETRPHASGLPGAFQDLGTWVDVFDFNPAHTNGRTPAVRPQDVDRMAAAGVKTLYIQAARPEDPKAPGDLVSPDLLEAFTRRAHSHGMKVVGWYLPYFSNLDDDMRHLEAMIEFSASGRRFDAIGLDIEWRAAVPDPKVRNERLVELSSRLQRAAAAKGLPVGAVVLPPVLLDHVNPNYWPGFPWQRLKPFYDAWVPMGYWTNRIGPEREAHHHTVHNVSLLRQYLGDDVPIHFAGGIGDTSTAGDYQAFAKAIRELRVGGLSVYDWATSGAGPMAHLRS